MFLTLEALVYDADFSPSQIEARQHSVRSSYLSVVLLLVQAPSLRSIDSESAQVTSLRADILIYWQTDVASKSV